jgi:hypothetical protein
MLQGNSASEDFDARPPFAIESETPGRRPTPHLHGRAKWEAMGRERFCIPSPARQPFKKDESGFTTPVMRHQAEMIFPVINAAAISIMRPDFSHSGSNRAKFHFNRLLGSFQSSIVPNEWQ